MPPLPDDHSETGNELSYEEIEHELKTPLASIRSISEIMRDYPDLPETERQRFLAVLLDDNERLMRMIDRLLGSPVVQKAFS